MERTILIIDAYLICKEDYKKMKQLNQLDLAFVINFENLSDLNQRTLKEAFIKEKIMCQIIFLMPKLVKHINFNVSMKQLYGAGLFKIPDASNMYFLDENQKFSLQNKKVYIINDFKRYKTFCKCCSEPIDIIIYLNGKLDKKTINTFRKCSLAPQIYINKNLCDKKASKLFKKYPVYKINKERITV